jgi:hypothetical protein
MEVMILTQVNLLSELLDDTNPLLEKVEQNYKSTFGKSRAKI